MFYGYTVNKFSAWICINHKNPIFWLFCGSLVDTRWDWILKFAVQLQITLKTNKNLIFFSITESKQSSNKMTRIFGGVSFNVKTSAKYFFTKFWCPKVNLLCFSDFFTEAKRFLQHSQKSGSKTVFPPLNSFNNSIC